MYYRSIEVYGRTFIPHTGRTLFIANHQAGLIDGLLVVASNKEVIRTLAKNTLWENPVIRVFANGLGMIPVLRKQDQAPLDASLSSAERNKQMFGAVEQAFLDREFVLLFPEGVSHSNAHILRLRSGAARMILQNEDAHDFRLGLKWAPISIDYEKREQPGSRVLIHYHPARTTLHMRDAYRRDPEATIEKLRREMEEYLLEVTVNFETWADRVFIERLTEIWLARSPARLLLDRHNQLIKWKRVMENTSKDDAELWNKLREEVTSLYASLTLLKLSPYDIFKRTPTGKHKLQTKVALRIFVFGPLIGAGLVFWKPPTLLIDFVAKKGATSLDVITSYKVVAGVIAYPLWIALVFPWIVGAVGKTSALGFLILALSGGIAALTVARKLRPQVRVVLGLYRYGSVSQFFKVTETRIEEICRKAARLWNHGLRRQILIETATDEEKKAS